MRWWGRFVFRRRRWILATCGLVAVLSVATFLAGGSFTDQNSFEFESQHGFTLLSNQLQTGTQFSVVFASTTLTTDQPAFASAVAAAVQPLGANPHVSRVENPFTEPAPQAAAQISTDHHKVEVVVDLKDQFSSARDYYAELRATVHSDVLQVSATGELPVSAAFDQYSTSDLERSELVSMPIVAILLLIVFGTVVAALLCLGVGALAVFAGLAGVYGLSHVTSVSPYAVNIVTLIGLGVAIDYSLFITSRFREELARGSDIATAVETTMATAGRAILFSSITVAIGLSGLLFYNGIFLVSLGLAGAIVVAASALFSLTFLPALLGVLGPRVNRLSVPILRPRPIGQGAWHRLARWVMRRPLAVLIPTVAVLVLAGTPFPHIRLASSDVAQLPASAEARQAHETLIHDFPGREQSVFDVVVDFHGSPTTAANAQALADLSARLGSISGVASVQTAATGRTIADIHITSPADPQGDQAHAIVDTIRATEHSTGLDAYTTGTTAFDIDFVTFMKDHTPAAILFVVSATLIVLLLLLRSIVLPVKAVVMNLLSLTAAFGALVFVIQDGHLHSVLGFEPAPIEPVLPAIIFCLVFGLSMDYEVFLMTRMQEAYRRSGSNIDAVAEGLEASGRLVTGAAAIMVVVFLGFALGAQEVVVKAVGLGLAVAIFVDATLVRALVVPALMRLLGRANWYAPQWLLRVLPGPHDH